MYFRRHAPWGTQYVIIGLWISAALACARADAPLDYGNITPVGETTPRWLQGPAPGPPTATLVPASPPVPGLPTTTPRATQDTSSSPTPDATRPSILDRQSVEEYLVRRGDTLGEIGSYYGVSAGQIAQANGVAVTDTLFVGQVLRIPVPKAQDFGPDLKLLPDSEFVYGPGTIGFNLQGFVQSQEGFLARYDEEIPGRYLDGSGQAATLSGSEIVQLVAERHSVNPRLLLALLEYRSGWVTQSNPGDDTLVFPMRRVEAGREGLHRQLSWAANQLNFGYYAWRAGAIVSWSFGDGSVKLIAPGLNPGTVSVQNYFAELSIADQWVGAVSVDGFIPTYWALFGNPFALAYEPLLPTDLLQPELSLPFEPGKVWAFTGGPHGAWDTGSAWAALDFAPPAEAEGCTPSDEWVTAAAPGVVVRSNLGAVVQDLDGDGYEQTGWTLLYMHVETRDRVPTGTRLNLGDRIGHPSCEGGVANGTHVHFARKYNGEWVPADGPIPFVLDGWVSIGLGREYDGIMTRGDLSIEACDCRVDFNQIARP